MCDVGHKQNRVPLVCSGKWDVLTTLAKCLIYENRDGRHLACLALNNLSIPIENKRVMVLGPASQAILEGLCKIIADDNDCSYLGCICLMNLSMLEDLSTTILQHSPVALGMQAITPLANPKSLLRVIEMFITNLATNFKTGSGTCQRIRWACGFIKNLAKGKDNAILISQTDIPKCIVHILQCTTNNPPPTPSPCTSICHANFSLWANSFIKNLSKTEDNAPLIRRNDAPKYVPEYNCTTSAALFPWISNSTEDFSLFVILHLAQWPVTKETLVKAGAFHIVKPVMTHGNLQGLKATMICAFLGATWESFPNGGSTAALIVSEVMTNVFMKRGKDGEYAHGVFQLYTVTKAYYHLAIAANQADTTGSVANIKTLALPSTVALLFQIISNHVLFVMDGDKGDTECVIDDETVEQAVCAIHALLPAILQVEKGPNLSLQSKKLCVEVSQMLLAFTEIPGTSPEAKSKSKAIADEITIALVHDCPILETSLALWTQHKTDNKTQEIV